MCRFDYADKIAHQAPMLDFARERFGLTPKSRAISRAIFGLVNIVPLLSLSTEAHTHPLAPPACGGRREGLARENGLGARVLGSLAVSKV